MIAPFIDTANPSRVLFGAGRLGELAAELARLGCRKAILLTTPEQAGLAEEQVMRDQYWNPRAPDALRAMLVRARAGERASAGKAMSS